MASVCMLPSRSRVSMPLYTRLQRDAARGYILRSSAKSKAWVISRPKIMQHGRKHLPVALVPELIRCKLLWLHKLF